MEEIKIREKLNSIRNEMTHLWTSFFIVGGGAITILLNNPDILRGIFGCIGIVFSILFFNAYFVRRNELLKLLDDLGELK